MPLVLLQRLGRRHNVRLHKTWVQVYLEDRNERNTGQSHANNNPFCICLSRTGILRITLPPCVERDNEERKESGFVSCMSAMSEYFWSMCTNAKPWLWQFLSTKSQNLSQCCLSIIYYYMFYFYLFFSLGFSYFWAFTIFVSFILLFIFLYLVQLEFLFKICLLFFTFRPSNIY